MRLYVEYRFVVPVEVDDDLYESRDAAEFAFMASSDPDFYECLPSEPVPFVEADYEVLSEDQARWFVGEPIRRAFCTELWTSPNPQVGTGD